MKRTCLSILAIIVLSALTCVAYADVPRDNGNSLDQGGTYCAGATVIPGNLTNYVDTGILDGDNDCSTPFAWPYNDVFYTFTPTLTRTYIFRLQLGMPSTDVALRIMANHCCGGGTSVNAVQDMVAADCDTGRVTYLRALLVAGTQYWFHIGDNSTAAHYSPYRFELLFVDCPRRDTTAMHHTCEIAQPIAANDSIMGDSSTFGHADWYSFTLDPASANYIVTISEFGRSFGHCNTGFYPLCMDNPLNAQFFVYCSCPASDSSQIAHANGELCSTDAQTTLCLPGGVTYYIKVENWGGTSWAGWDYILKIQSTPTTEICPILPTACFEERFLCPNAAPAETLVTLTPNMPVPGPQDTSACVNVAVTFGTTIFINVLGETRRPIVTVTSGCALCGNESCQGLTDFNFDSTAWVFSPERGGWVNRITTSPTSTGCCVCVRLERILPVELLSFAAISGDQNITLNWVTASELQNDHFVIARDGVPVTTIQGAGSSPSQHSYHYTDVGLTNYQTYTYTLTAVDVNGNQQPLGTVTAIPTAGPVVITEYALHQNYPNPFNPSTTVSFDLVENGLTTLKIYNLMGQEVASLVNGNLTSGRHNLVFNAGNLPSGIYVYRLAVNGFTAEKKMLLIK
ncbi:MAG TPA: T9SS type A sorting domain-containing protein [bacterium]